MRHALLAAALAAPLLGAAVPDALAAPRDRELTIEVRPRSFLDPGTTVPVGSRSRYVTDTIPRSAATPFYGFQNQSDLPLPDRFSNGSPIPFGGSGGIYRLP